MIKISLLGGLGNQMFQYAAGRSVALSKNVEMIADASSYAHYAVHTLRLDKLNCKCVISREKNLTTWLCKSRVGIELIKVLSLFGFYYYENNLLFDDAVFSVSDGVHLIGYFQSEKYFLNIRDELLDEFSLRVGLCRENEKYVVDIEAVESVAVHVRRGDYLLSENSVHGVCNKEYYEKAERYIKQAISPTKDIEVFVFSDDVEWCKRHLSFESPVFFVEGNDASPEIDLSLMALCKHQIISNSTFSWWGAWLNINKEKIVVAPSRWFYGSSIDSRDIIPEGWVRL